MPYCCQAPWLPCQRQAKVKVASTQYKYTVSFRIIDILVTSKSITIIVVSLPGICHNNDIESFVLFTQSVSGGELQLQTRLKCPQYSGRQVKMWLQKYRRSQSSVGWFRVIRNSIFVGHTWVQQTKKLPNTTLNSCYCLEELEDTFLTNLTNLFRFIPAT